MTCRYREELVGKRFISVRSPQKLKIQKISEWEWRSGVVRAVSGRDASNPDLSVLIEFDDIDWTRREWVRVHYTFQLFLVEHTLVWAERPDPDKHRHSISWPGLSFRAIVDKAGLAVCKRKPVEFLVDRFLGLVEEKEIQIFQEGEENSHPTALSRKEVQQALKEWLDYQDGQKILLTTPSVLVGYRLEVYRAEGTTQWYTAVIQSYNHTSKTLSITDDTVLEGHNEDPTLIQMHLIDDGVVDSILRGVELGGIAPRRRPRAVKQKKEQPMSTSRATSSTPAVSKSIPSNPKKSWTPQQSAVTIVSPALQSSIVTSNTEDGKGAKGTKVKLPNPKDKKKKLELHQNNGVTLNSNTKRIKTEHQDNKLKQEFKKFEPKLASEVQTSVRVSPRHIKDKRTRQQSSYEQVREKDVCELDTSTESIESESSDIGSNKVNTNIKSVSKIKVRSQQKVESLKSTSLKSESPKIRTNSPRGSSNLFQRRSLNRTPTEASSVIISSSNSGSIASKRKRKVFLGSDSAKIGNSDNKKTNIGITTADNQTTSESASSKKNIGLSCSGANYCDLGENKFKSNKNTNKAKEKHSESVSKVGVKKSARALCPEKQNKHTDKNKSHGNSHKGFTKSQGSLSAVKDSSTVSRENLYIDDLGDTMHYIKKKQSLLAGGTSSGSTQNSCISVSNIDLNRSLTDQIARAEKLSSANGEEKSGSVSSTLSSPVFESHTESPADHDNDSLSHYRDNRQIIIGPHNTNKCMVWSQEERSQSRNSDGQCSSGLSGDECRRPGSRFDDLKCSSKSSPTSSPLIVDKSEPVQIYRDPELMSKNPVRSNVPNMHNSHKSYPQLHNPIPTQASRPSSVGMTSTSLTSALDRQSRTPVIPSVAYPPLLGASLSNLLPPGLHQLDPATLALHQQIAVQQQHVAAALASQYSNVLSMSYPPRGNLSNSQLEHLWQQKYPPVPTAPPWMIAKHRDNFRHEVRALHEHEQLERERIERERELELREREQRERKDREKKIEKERLDRERFEREKLDQERTEREQIEREKQEKERQDRERLERERNRVLKESVDSQAAVDHHFTESLRLASQRAAQTGMWPTPSITLGTGKPKGDGQHSVKMGEVLPDEKIKQEQLGDTDYRNVELMRTHKELMTKQEEFLKQRKYLGHVPMERSSDTKAADMFKDIKSPVHVNYLRSIKHEQSSGIAPVPIKQELGTAKFSLYGYQPEKYTFITTDQLHSFDLDKVKNEKFDLKQSDCHSPRRKELSVPPPLIKDTKPHSSVIVENKVKDCSAKSSPLAHQQYQSHMSPHQQPKPAHTPDRPRSNSSSPGTHGLSPSMAHSQHISLRAEHMRQTMPRSQSPLRIASPQQLSAAVMQPMDYRCQKQNRSRGSPGSNISVQSAESVSLAIAQPPVALPLSSVAYTYSLIQQGLVPNPIYTNNAVGKCSDSQRTVSVTGTAQVPRASQSPSQNYSDNQQCCQQSNAARTKRKGQKEGNSCKRQKVCDASVMFQANNSQNISAPCTTTQISHHTIQPLYSTGSVTVPNYTNTVQSRGTYLASTQQVGTNRLNDFRDFNSFKLFVDKTVQNAFNSNPEFTNKDDQSKKPSGEQLNEQQQQQVNINSQFCQLKSSLELSCSPLTSQQNIQSQKTDALSNASNSNSALSYSDSICHVVNGQIDTDSDTLSVPSPPSHPKQEQTPSPHNAAKHPNLKKAWLQRHIYSDEDKQEIKPSVDVKEPIVADVIPVNKVNKLPDDLEKENEKEQVKNCYVNCSYISPSKDGGSKSPISTIQASSLPNGISEKMDTNDELTTSASETETQTSDSSSKKRVKTKPEKLPNPKKLKSEIEDESSTNSGQKKKTNRSRNKDKVPKNAADNMSEEQIKKIVENFKDSVKEKPLVKEAPSKLAEEAHNVDIDELSDEKSDQAENETNQNEDQFDTDSSSKKSDLNKEKETKKGKNIIRDKHKNKSDVELEANIVYVPPASMLKDTEQKAHQNTFSKPLVKLPDSVLRKTCEPFLQDGSCSEVTPKLMKCRECKMTPTQRGKTVPNIFCRFYAFRRLKYSQRGFVTIDGFSELTDAEQDDIEPWIPKFPIIEPTIDVNTARFIIRRLGDKFCELVQQEKEAQNCSRDNVKIAWKRAVTGVREMCDVCDTTLFNMHWVCHKCGFVVCLDCYMVKAKEFADDIKGNNKDGGYQEEQREWLTCSANRLPHEVDKLMLTQIIPADALWEVGRLVHKVRERWDIAHACPCTPKHESKKNGIKSELMHEAMKHISPKNRLVNGSNGNSRTKNGSIKNTVYNADSSSPLSLLADVASMDSGKVKERNESPINSKKDIKNAKSYTPITEPMSPGSSEKKMSTLRELLTKTAGGKVKNNSELNKKKSKVSASLNDNIQKVVEKHIPRNSDKFVKAHGDAEPLKLIHYMPCLGVSHMLVRETPIIAHNLTETSILYPDVPHSWLCDGRLLQLLDPRHHGNTKIFMEQWRRGQPVLVSRVDKYIDADLWKPDYFSKHFGKLENDLINCRSSCVVVGQPMKHFWDGFACMEERLVDEEGTPMMLKLKDWPPGDDFSDILPQQFNDLMQALPLPEYTQRDGRLNLVSRLPDFLVKPDLGPKMYIAYGSAQYPKEGTTNLHLDVSDAVNLMVFVGYFEEERGQIVKKQNTLKAMDVAHCDPITKRRIQEVRGAPGALWHIFDACDADKIRDFLNKVGKERGEKVELHHDPIHDQSWYLDEVLQDRLAKEYGVLGYTIRQCLGDAIFIPAGAPHQVRNLNNCIKVAEDFVSPENVHRCFQLTQEFRHLSDGHSNHEDKLQIKNIIYHAVKDAIAILNEADPDDCDD